MTARGEEEHGGVAIRAQGHTLWSIEIAVFIGFERRDLDTWRVPQVVPHLGVWGAGGQGYFKIKSSIIQIQSKKFPRKGEKGNLGQRKEEKGPEKGERVRKDGRERLRKEKL